MTGYRWAQGLGGLRLSVSVSAFCSSRAHLAQELLIVLAWILAC